jgi:hypothetical protein
MHKKRPKFCTTIAKARPGFDEYPSVQLNSSSPCIKTSTSFLYRCSIYFLSGSKKIYITIHQNTENTGAKAANKQFSAQFWKKKRKIFHTISKLKILFVTFSAGF